MIILLQIPRYNQEHQYSGQGNNEGHSSIYERYDYPGRYKRDAQGEPFTQYRLEYERREAELALAQSDDLRRANLAMYLA